MSLNINLFMSSLSTYFQHVAELNPKYNISVSNFPIPAPDSPRKAHYCLILKSEETAVNLFLDKDHRILGIVPDNNSSIYVRVRGFARADHMTASSVINFCQRLLYVFTHPKVLGILSYIGPESTGYTKPKLYVDLFHHFSERGEGKLTESELETLAALAGFKANTDLTRNAEFNLEPYKETDPASYLTPEALLADLRAGLDIDLTQIAENMLRQVLMLAQRRNKTRIMRMDHEEILSSLYEIFCEEEEPNEDVDDENDNFS